jgi:hypothetical protein
MVKLMAQEKEDSGSIPLINTDGLTPSPNNQVKEKEEKPKILLKSFLCIGNDIENYSKRGLYEAIFFDGQTYFLRCFNADRTENSPKLFSLQKSIITYEESAIGNPKKVTITPKVTSLELLPFDFAEKELESVFEGNKYLVPTTQDLFDRIYSMLKQYADIPSDWLNVCSLMVLMSYEQHKFNWLPYLGIFGDTGSGKSVLTEILSNLCYRCGYFFETNSADIYQYLSEYEDTIPCLAEDETQGLEKDNEKIKIYKSGNSRNGKVIRILQTPNGRKLLSYPTYCFKIITGEQTPTVKGLNERILNIPSSKGKPSKHWYDRTTDDTNEIKKLKWDLLKWRMANYDKNYQEAIHSTSRIEDNLKPLRVLAKGLSIASSFEKWAKDAILKSESEKKSTLEGCTVEAIYTVINRGLFAKEVVLQGQEASKIYINFDSIWEQIKTITLATLDNDKLQTVEFGEITKNKIGRILSNIFASKSVSRADSTNNKVRCRTFEIEMLLRVISNYFDEAETERLNIKIQQSDGKETEL